MTRCVKVGVDHPDVVRLLETYFAELAVRFGAFDPPSPDELRADARHGLVLVAYDGEEPVACGSLRRLGPEIAEVKRMFVAERARRQGHARALLRALEEAAAALGCRTVVLDTAAVLEEAARLYLREGYREIPRYNANPHATRWFRKDLPAGPGAATNFSAPLSIPADPGRRLYERTQPGHPALPSRKETTMKVMVIVKATKNSEAGLMPDEKLLAAMGKYNEELVAAGIMQAGEGLHPSAKGKRVKIAGDKRTVVDGPFPETKELVAGFWLWQVKSMDEAVAWARRCPEPMPGEEAELEIRPVFEAEDFGAEFTPELRAQEERLRAELEQRNRS